VQRCPVVPNAPTGPRRGARSRSASSMTICAFFPQVSSDNVERSACVARNLLANISGTGEQNQIYIGCVTMALPTSLPPPWTRFTKLLRECRFHHDANESCSCLCVSLAGLKTTVFPESMRKYSPSRNSHWEIPRCNNCRHPTGTRIHRKFIGISDGRYGK